MTPPKEFVTRGPITNPDREIYIERQEDKAILTHIFRGDWIMIFGPRQTGKTSLLNMLERESRQFMIPVRFDFSVPRDTGKWYTTISRKIVNSLPEAESGQIGEIDESMSPSQFQELLKKVAHTIPGASRVVLLFDELEGIPKELGAGFLNTLRSIYLERQSYDEKYICVFAAATPLRNLTSHYGAEAISPTSPFNVAEPIFTSNFERNRIGELAENLRLRQVEIEDSAVDRIYDWTHGHPNLTMEIFDRLLNTSPQNVTEEIVDGVVTDLIKKGCNNLSHLLRYITVKDTWSKIDSILGKRFSQTSGVVSELALIGAIREGESGQCVIHNKIYEEVFELNRPEPVQKTEPSREGWLREQLLVNYRGVICSRFTEAGDTPLEAVDDDGLYAVAHPGQECKLKVWLQPTPPEPGVFYDSINIRNGQDAEAVTFEISLDSDELEFDERYQVIEMATGKASQPIDFLFTAPVPSEATDSDERDRYDVWVEVYQKDKLCQNVRATIQI